MSFKDRKTIVVVVLLVLAFSSLAFSRLVKFHSNNSAVQNMDSRPTDRTNETLVTQNALVTDNIVTKDNNSSPKQNYTKNSDTEIIQDGKTSQIDNQIVESGSETSIPDSNSQTVANSLNNIQPSVSDIPLTSPVSSSSSQTIESKMTTPESVTHRVIINELAWMGTVSSSTDEWIELYNTENHSVDISGWKLVSADGTPSITIKDSAIISSNGYYLLERTADSTISDTPADQIYTGALGNNGETMGFYDKNGNLIDKVGDSGVPWYAGDNTSKSSMERINPSLSGNDATNWATNNGIIRNGIDAEGYQIMGTPGAKNSVFSI